MEQSLRRSVLYSRHVRRGARFAAFAGWQMPVEYQGGGVLAEHAAVRNAVGMFDVSHLGKIRVRGRGAAAHLNRCLTNDLDRIGTGRAQYTLCCDDNGGVIDDMIVYRFGDDEVFCIPNAANAATVAQRLAADAPDGITVTDEHDRHAVIAVQGPRSAELLATVGLPSGHPYLSFVQTGGAVVCRTGYTGEHGYEIVAPVDEAGGLWDELAAAGVGLGLLPCGLGARDTLRTEMGYPLHGQDISREITPVQAGLGWAVGWHKPAFWGRSALLAEVADGPRRRLWGLELAGRAVPRPRMAVRVGDHLAGEVTSGTFSPTRRVGIALALLDTAAAPEPGGQVELDVRGRWVPAHIAAPPFVAVRVR